MVYPAKHPFQRRASWRRILAILVGLTVLASTAVVGGSQETASAQSDGDTTMLLFDLSGSMGRTEPDGRTRLAIAQNAMIQALGALTPGSTNIGIRSFSNCGVSNLEQAPAPVDPASLAATINSFSTGGATDIANALTSVANDFANTAGRKSVILLSDGLDNCGGDPCATARALIAAGVDIIVNAIGIGTAGTAAEAQLGCIASVTGGTIISVDSPEELFDAIDVAISGGATSAFVRSAGTVCVNSALVQSNPVLQSLSVGDSYTDNAGNQQIIISGETCGYDCHDGFDLNCDGVLGDFCESDLGRTTVAGVGECIAADATEDDTDNPECTGSLIECYAPEVRFHPLERFFPMDPVDFIAGSTLTWVHSANGIQRRCYRDEPIVVSPDPFLLGQGTAYFERQLEPTSRFGRNCEYFGRNYATDEFTRPYDEQPANTTFGARATDDNNQILEVQEGFVLEWNSYDGRDNFDRPLGLNGGLGAPMFAQIFQSPDYGRAIIYHMFYGFDPKSRQDGDGIVAHEGDWERVIVILNPDDTPREVRFEGHGCSTAEFARNNYIPWGNMSNQVAPPTTPGTGHLVDGTHPVVYVAEGSHASYPYLRPIGNRACFARNIGPIEVNSGEKDDTVFNSQSGVWRPWETGQLLEAQDQCWYGFGGAWGDTGDALTIVGTADDTGPAGPHWNIDGLLPGTNCTRGQRTVLVSATDDLDYGDTVTLALTGHTPGTQVIASVASVEIALAVAVIGSDGSGNLSFSIPAGFEPGGHQIIVRDVATGEVLSVNQANINPPAGCFIPGDGRSIANDIDGDNLLDSCDNYLTTGPAADFDGDGINNFDDTCPRVVNPDQAGLSQSPIGFACAIDQGHNPAAQLFLELTSESVPNPSGALAGSSIPVPSGTQLAHTGTESALLTGLGLNLIAIGMAAVGVCRVRRRRPTWTVHNNPPT